MVEVPALLYQMDELLKKVDFVSVGSNDLFQFLFAVDRGNAKGPERFDTHVGPDPAGVARDRAEGQCGEEIRFAVRRDGLEADRRVGTDRTRLPSLSLSATGHGPVKALVLDLDARKPKR